MENRIIKRKITRKRRVMRVRKKLRGTASKPRLSVCKTNKHLYAQLIDDEAGVTLAFASTLTKEKQKKSQSSAKTLGSKLAELAGKQNIKFVVFDRGRFKYHGLIKTLADAVREGGLQF